ESVTYINDSKATNTASTAPALAAYPPRDGTPRIHWIVGGLAKEEGLGECEAHLGNVAAAYTVGEAGPRFADALEGKVPRVERCELISEAVQRAQASAKPGDVVLFSPACASFDQFASFEARGDAFKAAVARLNQPAVMEGA
ncbi:MAG: UDP-N-acetylmuramoyl-L-alanine--D-glutamate ligase, partial [Pseudomonadota bacterium]